MSILIAKRVGGTWQRVRVVRARKDGGVSDASLTGTLHGHFAREAARFFAAEPAAVDVFCGHGTHEFRITRI